MKALLALFICLVATSNAAANTFCNGTVNAVYKWNTMTNLSMQIALGDGTTLNWINLPTKSDEAMALLAFASGKPIQVYWNAADVTVCPSGWVHNRVLDGFFVVLK